MKRFGLVLSLGMLSIAAPQVTFAQANGPLGVILASCAGNSCQPSVDSYLKGLPGGRANDTQIQELSVALAELGQGARTPRQCKDISAALISLSNSAASSELKSQILGIAQSLCARTFVTAAILAVERDQANGDEGGDNNNLMVADNNPVVDPGDPKDDEPVVDDQEEEQPGDEPSDEPVVDFTPPGFGSTPPGQGGTPPGQTTPPGQGGTPPGQTTPPGQGDTPPGNSGSAPGKNK